MIEIVEFDRKHKIGFCCLKILKSRVGERDNVNLTLMSRWLVRSLGFSRL